MRSSTVRPKAGRGCHRQKHVQHLLCSGCGRHSVSVPKGLPLPTRGTDAPSAPGRADRPWQRPSRRTSRHLRSLGTLSFPTHWASRPAASGAGSVGPQHRAAATWCVPWTNSHRRSFYVGVICPRRPQGGSSDVHPFTHPSPRDQPLFECA